jgi:hypothetical protein
MEPAWLVRMLDQLFCKSVPFFTNLIHYVQNFFLKLDPGHRLLMDLEGKKPANPFPDERSFEDSLQLNFHPGKYFYSLLYFVS